MNYLPLAVDLLGSAMTLYGAAFVIALSKPMFFYLHFAVEGEPRSKLHAVIVYSLVVLKIVCIGKFFYHAAYGIFDVIPYDWINFDEDGDPGTRVRTELQVMFAVIATALSLDSVGKVGALGAKLYEEDRRRYDY